MGGSYRQCTECGKQALSIATRCPGCGCEFPARAIVTGGSAPRQLGGLLTPGRVAGVLGVLAVLASASFGGSSQTPEEQSASVAPYSVPALSEVDSAPTPTPSAESAGELRVARDWTHVRKSRSVNGALEAMLMPGDTVLADSLGKGWYRVALEGEVLGYAHRSTLSAVH